jgi:hypothetical protein
MKPHFEPLAEFLDPKNPGYIGFGYGQLKKTALRAAALFGVEWANKNPRSADAIALRQELRNLIMAFTPKSHSNKYVVWQRFCRYALDGITKSFAVPLSDSPQVAVGRRLT